VSSSGDEPLVPARAAESPVRRVAGSRRVVRPGNEAADPTPHDTTSRLEEDAEVGTQPGAASSGNDEQLRRDKPPHWG